MQGQNKAEVIKFAMNEAPAIIQGTENAMTGEPGADKHEIAMAALSLAVSGGETAVIAANPAYAGFVPLFNALIGAIIRGAALRGNPFRPQPVVTPAPVATPVAVAMPDIVNGVSASS
jgi:hypothetical protein